MAKKRICNSSYYSQRNLRGYYVCKVIRGLDQIDARQFLCSPENYTSTLSCSQMGPRNWFWITGKLVKAMCTSSRPGHEKLFLCFLFSVCSDSEATREEGGIIRCKELGPWLYHLEESLWGELLNMHQTIQTARKMNDKTLIVISHCDLRTICFKSMHKESYIIH